MRYPILTRILQGVLDDMKQRWPETFQLAAERDAAGLCGRCGGKPGEGPGCESCGHVPSAWIDPTPDELADLEVGLSSLLARSRCSR